MERRLEGWRVASKPLGALSRMRWAALGRGGGREGRGALPLPRAAVISTGLRVQLDEPRRVERRAAHRLGAIGEERVDLGGARALRGGVRRARLVRVRVRVRVKVRVRVRVGVRVSPQRSPA